MDIVFTDKSKPLCLDDDFTREAIVIESILCGNIELARSLAKYTVGPFDDMLMAATAASNPVFIDESIQAMLLEMLKSSIEMKLTHLYKNLKDVCHIRQL